MSGVTAFLRAGRSMVSVTTPSARSIRSPCTGRYRIAVGFNPFRKQVKRRGDVFLVAAALLVAALLVLWAALPR
jgi:hypothetical protein